MEKLKLLDQANILHAALVLFGHDLIPKEKFFEICSRVIDTLNENILK